MHGAGVLHWYKMQSACQLMILWDPINQSPMWSLDYAFRTTCVE